MWNPLKNGPLMTSNALQIWLLVLQTSPFKAVKTRQKVYKTTPSRAWFFHHTHDFWTRCIAHTILSITRVIIPKARYSFLLNFATKNCLKTSYKTPDMINLLDKRQDVNCVGKNARFFIMSSWYLGFAMFFRLLHFLHTSSYVALL